MNETMRERIARAIDPEAFGLPDNAAQDSITDRDIARDRADAVLSAMREPTAEMVSALQGWAICSGYIEKGWAAAIDAAGSRLTQSPSAPADALNDREPLRGLSKQILSLSVALTLNRRPK